MNWPYLKRGDIAGILLMSVLLVVVLFVMLFFPDLGWKSNFGFGPEWVCTWVGQGDPVCIKMRRGEDREKPEKQISN